MPMLRANVARPGAPSSTNRTLVPCEMRNLCSSRRKKRQPSRSVSAAEASRYPEDSRAETAISVSVERTRMS